MNRSLGAIALFCAIAATPSSWAQHSGYNEEAIAKHAEEMRTAAGVAKLLHEELNKSTLFGSCGVVSKYTPRTGQGRDAEPASLDVDVTLRSGEKVSVSFELDSRTEFEAGDHSFLIRNAERSRCDHADCQSIVDTWVILQSKRLTVMRMTGHAQMSKWEVSRAECERRD